MTSTVSDLLIPASARTKAATKEAASKDVGADAPQGDGFAAALTAANGDSNSSEAAKTPSDARSAKESAPAQDGPSTPTMEATGAQAAPAPTGEPPGNKQAEVPQQQTPAGNSGATGNSGAIAALQGVLLEGTGEPSEPQPADGEVALTPFLALAGAQSENIPNLRSGDGRASQVAAIRGPGDAGLRGGAIDGDDAIAAMRALLTGKPAKAPGTPTLPGNDAANELGGPLRLAAPLAGQALGGGDSGLVTPGPTNLNNGTGNIAPHHQVAGAALQQATTTATGSAQPQTLQTATPLSQQAIADLAVETRLHHGGNASEQGTSGNANDGKPSLRAAALALPGDARPVDGQTGQTFATALGSAGGSQAAESARESKAATQQQPARAAIPTPAAAQIAVHIVRAAADGVSRFNVQMHPAELGRVEVKLEVSRDGTVHARVFADRQETVDQLQRDSRALERALQDAGLKADSQNLHFSLRGGQNGRDLPENRGSAKNGGHMADDPAEVAAPVMAASWSNVAGATGALDIRV